MVSSRIVMSLFVLMCAVLAVSSGLHINQHATHQLRFRRQVAQNQAPEQAAPEYQGAEDPDQESQGVEASSPQDQVPDNAAPENEGSGDAAAENQESENATPGSLVPDEAAQNNEGSDNAAQEGEAPVDNAQENQEPEDAAAENQGPDDAGQENREPENDAQESQGPVVNAQENQEPENVDSGNQGTEDSVTENQEQEDAAQQQQGEQEGSTPENQEDVSEATTPNSVQYPFWTTCNFGVDPIKSCYDCNSLIICKHIGGLVKPCGNPFRPYCDNGRCSPFPSAECV